VEFELEVRGCRGDDAGGEGGRRSDLLWLNSGHIEKEVGLPIFNFFNGGRQFSLFMKKCTSWITHVSEIYALLPCKHCLCSFIGVSSMEVVYGVAN
jgi:hypothetical protein